MAILEFTDLCPNCGSEKIETQSYADEIHYKGFLLDVENLHELKCEACQQTWETNKEFQHNLSLIKDAYALVRDLKRESEGLLTSKEIENIRVGFSLNQREAAELFGGGYNAFNKYESGEVLQSFAMDRLLRMTKAFGKYALEFLKDVDKDHNLTVTNTIVNSENTVVPNFFFSANKANKESNTGSGSNSSSEKKYNPFNLQSKAPILERRTAQS